MISNLSATLNGAIINYPTLDSSLPFSDYVAHCRSIIAERRTDLLNNPHADTIINANSPYELRPTNPIKSGQKSKYGALLIHGLLDCPFSLRDLGNRFQTKGIYCRSILLPGHGTRPSDLLHVSYHDWIQAVHYGVETLRNEVEQVFLVGYSTGGALAIHQALQDAQIAGLVLLAPAIKIKKPIDVLVHWYSFLTWFADNKEWIRQEPELDYTKYLSIAFNPVQQVSQLTNVITALTAERRVTCPIFMTVSCEDEVISSHGALDFFSNQPNMESKLLLYSSYDHSYPDTRISTRLATHPDLHINHLSHVAIPFTSANPHYGQHGDYIYAARSVANVQYGAYNPLEIDCYDALYKLKLIKQKRQELTYNPDFEYMAEQMLDFILQPAT